MTSTHSPLTDRTTLRPGQSLLRFAGVALPAGWAFLSVPLFTRWPVEPFVLATLFLGMVPVALLLTRNGQHTTVRSLLRDCVRLPRPLAWLVPAALLIPVATRLGASAAGGGEQVTTDLLVDLTVNVVSSILIVNLWEEMVWAGFVQRTASHAYGFVRGALLTAGLFVAIHLPLAFYGVEDVADVGRNLAIMVASGVGVRFLVGALDRWGRGSILAIALLHATFNASSDLVDASHDWIRYAVTLGFGLLVLFAPGLRRSHAWTEELR
jgi:membrane protease YdiL (CAAX protease family)